jgi:hypothetical protein
MQLAQESKKIIRSGDIAESKFKIEASAKAFGILSSKLYSDQYRAIVRELCTNASDSHAAAGIKDRPIVVHAPNTMNSEFSVQDFGQGIDPTEFEKIYTTYFYSTKTDTNTQVGCFGLGSKSPFAYTQQFSVENCFGGTKYTYTCYINNNGEPSVSLLAQSPTEESGLKVSFSVKRENFYDFERAIVGVLRWFDVTPECNVSISNDSFSGLVKRMPYGTGLPSDYNVRMGQVVYPVTRTYLSKFLLRGSVVNLEIGDVDITPSRESLEYRQKTIDKLNQISEELGEDFKNNVSAIMQNNELSGFGKFKELYSYWKDSGYGEEAYTDAVSTHFPNAWNTSTFTTLDNNDFNSEIICFSKSSWKKTLNSYHPSKVPVERSSVILIKDKKSLVNKKMIQIFNDIVPRQIILVPPDHKDAFLKAINGSENDIIYASKYELKKDGVTVSKENNNCCKLIKDFRGYRKSGCKITKDHKDGFYISEKFYDLALSTESFASTCFYRIHKKEGNPELYIFTENQYNQLRISQRNFKNFLDVLLEKTKAEKNEVVTAITNDIIANSIRHLRSIDLGKKSKTNSLFKQYADYHSSLNIAGDSDQSAYYEGLLELLKWHDRSFYDSVKDDIDKKVGEFTSLQNMAIEKYPLVKIMLDNSQWDGIIDSVVEYVDLMESKGE